MIARSSFLWYNKRSGGVSMAKEKKQYVCQSCHSVFGKWTGQCPSCKEWNTLEEQVEKSGRTKTKTIVPRTLREVTTLSSKRILTGIDEFDRVAGGGFVEDETLIVSAPPGTGKSTLCIMLADALLKKGKTCVYATGEESASQIRNRADRLKLSAIDDLYISDTTSMDEVISLVQTVDADFVVVDSIQTFTLEEFLPSRAGNPTQVMECASALQDLAKRSSKPRIIILIGQMNKDDELVGMRALEHLVDATFILDGNADDNFRMLFARKNRFGDTGETGFFQMTETGLLSVENPSEFFATERTAPVVGTSLTVLKEGTRPLVVEIESLVTPSFTPYPSRNTEAMNREQLNVILSILEQHCKMSFFNKNVVIKTQNNIRLKTADTTLAILMTIVSSYYKQPLPLNSVYLADVGLTGELKKVQNIETRLKELDRMGYQDVFLAKGSKIPSIKWKNIQIHTYQHVSEILEYLGFGKGKTT